MAEECGIVSKGAAYVLLPSRLLMLTHSYGNIKYRRLKDKFGTASTSASTPTGDEENPGGEGAEETPKKKTPAKKGGTKKRKLSEADDAETTPVKKEEAEDVCVSLPNVDELPLTGRSRNRFFLHHRVPMLGHTAQLARDKGGPFTHITTTATHRQRQIKIFQQERMAG